MLLLVFSKQRHNKLWRSHSDSDLSEQQEPVCKSPRTLGRSDPHNQQHKPSGTRSVNNMLQMINSSRPGKENNHTGPCTRATSQKTSERPCEDPLLPTLPRARAATVVPEQNLADSCRHKVAVTKPIGHPRSPPSLHVLPRSLSTSLHGPKPQTVPEPKIDSDELSLDVPDQNDSPKNPQPSETLSLALCLDTVSSGTETGGELASSRTPMAVSPCEVPLESRCVISSSSEACCGDQASQKTGSSTSLGTDSIDFFSAREKFLGLSRDGQTGSLCEAVTPRMAQSHSPSLCLEDSNPTAAKEVKASSHGAWTEWIGLLNLICNI